MWHKIWENKLTLLTLLLAVSFRLYAIFQPAQPYDMGTYQAWGQLMLKLGPTEFFSTTWSDYLPLPIYLFTGVSWLSTTLGVDFPLLFKLFFSTLELSLLAWIFRLSRSLFSRLSSLPSTIYYLLILSPALILDTSWWGQIDSIPALLTVLSLLYFQKFLSSKTIHYFLITVSLITLAISLKPIMLLSLPVFAILYFTSPRRPPFLSLLPYVLCSISLFLLPAIPVAGLTGSFQFLLAKALEQANTYPYTSINAFNFWTLRSSLSSWPSDAQVVLGLSAHNLGLILFSFFSIYSFYLWSRTTWDKKHSFRLLATTLIAFFTFTTRMHERHLLFGLPFLALATLTQPFLIFPYLLYTLSYTLNLWGAYEWVIHNQTWPMPIFLANLASWLTTVTTIFLTLVWDWPRTFRHLRSWLHKNSLLSLILVFSLLLRLFTLGYPQTHIFDEVYHAFTAQELVAGHPEAWEWWNTPPEGFAYEWTHPPVAKYGMVAGLLLFGDQAFSWRFFSAILGVLGILGIYQLTLTLFGKKKTALLAAFLLSIEGLHLVQSRIGMNDIYMLTFFTWSLNQALHRRWKLSAVLYGLALASKWSALYGLLSLAIIFFHSYGRSLLAHIIQITRLLLISLTVYLLSYTPFFLSGHTWTQFFELHRQMWYYHTNLVATHAYQSTPIQWLFSIRPVWYWVSYGDKTANIYAQSNPLIAWLSLAAFVSMLKKISNFPYLLLYTTILIFTIPWVVSPRIMFFYHYLPSLTFLTIILATWFTSLSPHTRIFFLILLTTAFCLLTPIYYGFPLPQSYWDTLFTIFPTWK